LAFNAAGSLFESDQASGFVYEYTGGVRSTFASGLNSPNDLAFNSAGNLFVGVSNGNGSGGYIAEFTPGGAANTFASGIVEPNGLEFQPVPEPSAFALIGAGALIFLTCFGARKSTILEG
jgi:sugar lactone lactonase YvrE